VEIGSAAWHFVKLDQRAIVDAWRSEFLLRNTSWQSVFFTHGRPARRGDFALAIDRCAPAAHRMGSQRSRCTRLYDSPVLAQLARATAPGAWRGARAVLQTDQPCTLSDRRSS